jgi:hypothetical protein
MEWMRRTTELWNTPHSFLNAPPNSGIRSHSYTANWQKLISSSLMWIELKKEKEHCLTQ